MARIKKLTSKEIEHLRMMIVETFVLRNPDDVLPPQNAYLPNYEELKTDIHEAVAEVNGSVSENRLRKLFYYTNSNAVDPEALRKPHFGVDFLNACYKYISGNVLDRKSYKQAQQSSDLPVRDRSVLWISMSVLGLIVIGLIWTQATQKVKSHEFIPMIEQFDDVTFEGLQQRGWQVLDYDKDHFVEQHRDSFFTLYTLPGSYWIKPEEQIAVPNTLVHPIRQGASGVRVCFDQFRPYQDWQSIGLVIFDKHLNREDVIIAGFGYVSDNLAKLLPPYMYTGYKLKAGVPDTPFLIMQADPDQSDGATLRLDVRWNNEQFVFYTGTNEKAGFTQEWEPFRKMGSIPRAFEPAYIGIFACQGWTNDRREPLGADIIPAYLDWVEIY